MRSFHACVVLQLFNISRTSFTPSRCCPVLTNAAAPTPLVPPPQVRLAEQREAAAKAEITSLLEGRGELYERAEGAKESDGAPGDTAGRRGEANRRMELTRDKFNRLRSIGIAAEQVRRGETDPVFGQP